MSSIHKGDIFRELYIGTHWTSLLFLMLIHFQFEQSSHTAGGVVIIIALIYYLTEVLYWLRHKNSPVSSQIWGYFQFFGDLAIVLVFILMYPAYHSALLPLSLMIILTHSLHNPKVDVTRSSMISALLLGLIQFKLSKGMDISNITIMLQSISIFFWGFLVSEINKIFDRLMDENHFVMEEVEYKNRLLEKSSKTDFLTDLYNHQAFYQSLENIAAVKTPLTLIMMDIDNFKKINDDFGHIAGDFILREVAQIIKESVRCTDIAARYGGEEFAILLPSSDLTVGYQIAERIRTQIEGYPFIIDQQKIPVTISGGVGVSSISLSKNEQSIFVDCVDELLYRAKHSGRNLIITHDKEGFINEKIYAKQTYCQHEQYV